MRGQNDCGWAAGRKNAVAFKRPNGLSKKALMHQAVKDGPEDDEPVFLDLSENFWSTFAAAHADCMSRFLFNLMMAEIISART